MKPTSINLTAGMLLSSVLFITGCASDPIDTGIDRNEEYNREFIKAFGVPSANHNWSDAEKTSLTIKSTHGAAIKVFYESEGQLFLTGDLTVAAGSQQIPFIIPDGVTTLKVEANGAQYEVSVGSTLDLDHSTPSRSFGTSAEYGNGTWKVEYATDENTQRENYIRFTRDELAKVFFDAFPISEKNFSKPDAIYGGGLSAQNNVNPDSKFYYIYPIFWSNKNKKATADQFRFGSLTRDARGNYTEVWFDDPSFKHDVNPGPYSSPMCFNAVKHNGTDIYNDDTNFFCGDWQISDSEISGMSQSYSLDGSDRTIQSQGIKITGSLTPTVKFGDYGITSSDYFHLTCYAWSGRYWNLPLDKMDCSRKGVVFYMPSKKSVKFKVWRKQTDGNYAWEERSRQGIFIGVSAPPKKYVKNSYNYGDDTPCDFCDVVYFVAAEDENTVLKADDSYAWSSAVPHPFLIAAEDLGGSYDWDFNDAVFQVSCITRNSSDIANSFYESYFYPSTAFDWELNLPYVYQIEVTPLAAGGTMPIYIAYHGRVGMWNADVVEDVDPATTKYNDILDRIVKFQNNTGWIDGTWIIGTELHKWLGASSHTAPINVGEKITHTGRSVKFHVDTELELSEAPGKKNAPLMQFSVIVDKENSLGINTSNFDPNSTEAYPIPTRFNGTLGEGAYQISPVSEDNSLVSPQMFCIYNGDWAWPQEKHNIKLAYPKFAGWVENQANNTGWHNSSNSDSNHTVKRE